MHLLQENGPFFGKAILVYRGVFVIRQSGQFE